MKKLLISISSLVLAAAAHAGTFAGTATGVWGNLSGGTTYGSGTDTFSYGSATGTKRSVQFTGGAIAGDFGSALTSTLGTSFSLGQLTFTNPGAIANGTTPTSVDLIASMVINGYNHAFNFTLKPGICTSTSSAANGGPCSPSAATLSQSLSGTSQFAMGTGLYDIKLSGWSAPTVATSLINGTTGNWHVNHGTTATVNLFATISEVIAPVPEPESAALLLTGLGVMSLVMRRRKNSVAA